MYNHKTFKVKLKQIFFHFLETSDSEECFFNNVLEICKQSEISELV